MVSYRSRCKLALVAIIAGAFLVGSTPASAQSRAEQRKAKRLFGTGNKAFTDGRYSDALASYTASFELVKRPRTLYNIAVCRDRLGNLEQAYVDYNGFLAIAQARDATLVEKAKARVTELEPTITVAVLITSNPTGAKILGDEQDVILGVTPAELSVGLGTHTFRLEADSHRPKEVTITVVAGKRQPVEVVLDPLGKVSITATPADAQITLIGSALPAATGRLSATLDPGTYQIEVTKDGYEPQTVDIKLAGRDSVNRAVTLRKIQVEPPPPPPLPPRRIDPPVSTRGRVLRYSGIGAAAVGGTAILFAVYQGTRATSLSDDAQRSADEGMWNPNAFEDAESAQKLMYVSYAVGGLALAAGVTLYYLGYREARRPAETPAPRPRVTWQPTVGPRGAGLTVLGRF